MKAPRRTVYMLLVALICVNILVRIPRTEHETGVDSFFVHTLATAISEQGRIPWVLNPLGYFGWYPLSYPSGGPMLISGLAQMGDVPEEASILFLSFLYGALGALGAFVMARAFRRDDAFALVVAVLYSLAPRYMSFTLWSASSRNLFMALVPFFVFMLVRTYRRPTGPNFLVLISVLVLTIATHRLTILLAVVVIAFVVAYVFILINRVIRIRFPRILLSQRVRRWTPRLALMGIIAIVAMMFTNQGILDEYSEGEICAGASLIDQACNLGVSITRSVGLALPFALLGVMELVRQRHKGFMEAFLVFSLLALVPTLFLRQYTGFYILPFLAIFGGFGVAAIVRLFAKRPHARSAIVIASVLAISGSSFAILEFEVGRNTSMSNATYSTALYLNDLPQGNFVANDGLLGIRVASVSARNGLPVGGAGTTHQSPELLIMGAFNVSAVFSREQRIPLTSLTIEDDSPFILVGIDALTAWTADIMKKTADMVSGGLVRQYGMSYYLENDLYRDAYIAFDDVYDGKLDPTLVVFPGSVYDTRYRLYDGPGADLYLVWRPPTP